MMGRALLFLGAAALAIAGCRSTVKLDPQGSPTTVASSTATSSAADRTPTEPDPAFEDLRQIVKLERWYGASGRPAAIAWLQGRLGESTDKVDLEEFDRVEPRSRIRYRLTNIIARQRPEAKRRILFGSHWDSRLWAEEDPSPAMRDRPAAYANDGGSGVAVLLQLARRTRSMTGIGVDYVLFDGEEFGRPGSDDYCQGSREYAERLAKRDRSARPEAVIVLDMVGDADLGIWQEQTSLLKAPDLTRALWDTAAALGHREFKQAPKYAITDDQTPFHELGIPAVLLIDYDYPWWHTHGDTIDRVSPRSLEIVGDVLFQFLQRRAK